MLMILNIETKTFQKDASHGLSLEKKEYNINKNHPRLVEKDPLSK